MKQIINRLKNQLDSLARHPEVQKLKTHTEKALYRASIPIPLSSKMIQTAIVQAQVEDVQKIRVRIREGHLHISGEARKWMLKLPFSLTLRPSHAHGRTIAFFIQEMNPILNEKFNQHLFNRPPYLQYENQQIFLDLNQIEAIRKIRKGSVKQMEIRGETLWIKIGV